jgi:hypothetical protein
VTAEDALPSLAVDAGIRQRVQKPDAALSWLEGGYTLIPVTADPGFAGVETTHFDQRAELSERQVSLK